MPNNNVFNTDSEPLYMEQTNTYSNPGIGSDQEWEAAVNGILFMASTSGSLTSGQSMLLQVTNPGASGKNMYLSFVSGSISAAGTLALLRGGTFSGTTVTPVNSNFGSAAASSMTVQRLAGSISGSPLTLSSLILSGGPSLSRFSGRIIVTPGTSITVSVGTGAASASANLSWWEY